MQNKASSCSNSPFPSDHVIFQQMNYGNTNEKFKHKVWVQTWITKGENTRENNKIFKHKQQLREVMSVFGLDFPDLSVLNLVYAVLPCNNLLHLLAKTPFIICIVLCM